MTQPLRAEDGQRRETDSAQARGATDVESEEQRFVARIRAGDEAAFDELVLTYGPPLRELLRGMVESVAAAEDLTQELFLRIWRIRETWYVQSSLRGYLYRAARNLAFRHSRRAQLNQRWEARVVQRGEAPAMGNVRGPADQHAEDADFDTALRRAIRRLPPRCREVAVLRLYYDLPHAEIASAMGVTVKAVERLVTRTLKALRADLIPYITQ